MAEPAVEVCRGARVESVIGADAAVVDSAGRIVAWVGNPDRATYMRSTAKPFQAVPVVTSGAGEAFRISGEDLALMTSSHRGEPEQVARVEALLDRAGIAPGQVLVAGSESGLAHGCSGSHTGMLLAARARANPLDGYERMDHPVQMAIREIIAEAAGLPSGAALESALDACGVPTFYLSLSRMAAAYAQLADPRGLGVTAGAALEIVGEAMRQFPRWVSGSDTVGARLQEASGKRIIVKPGAEGMVCVAVLDRGLGIALKMDDGSARGVPVALGAILCELGVLPATVTGDLADLLTPVLRDVTGQVAGELRSVVTMHLGRLPNARGRL